MSKRSRRALLAVAVILVLMSAALLLFALAPGPARLIERTAIAPVAPTVAQ